MRAGNPKKDSSCRRKRANLKIIGGRAFYITVDGKGIRIYRLDPNRYKGRSKYTRHQGEKECLKRRGCQYTAEMLKTSRRMGWT